MQYGQLLIDKAAKTCSSDAELARKLKLSRAHISMMRDGKRTVTPEIAVLLADMVNIDPMEAMRQVVLDAAPMSKNGGKIKEILGKGLAVGAVALSGISYSNASTIPEESAKDCLQNVNPVYIVSIWAKRLKERAKQILRKKRIPTDLTRWQAT